MSKVEWGFIENSVFVPLSGKTSLKGSGTRFYCPALKGVDSKTQEQVSKWIQLLHKHPAHLHALDIKDAQIQRDPGIEHYYL